MIYVYRLLVLLFIRPLLQLWYKLSPQALSGWVHLREKKINYPKLTGCYWLHASSGEIEYGKSLIRLIRKNNPQVPIVLTYSSPSAEKLFSDITDAVDYFIPLCWDTPQAVQELIHHLNPKCMIFIKTDLWPELITQLHEKKIPLYILAYAPRLNLFFRFFTVNLLKKFSYISCTDEQVKQTLQPLLADVPLGAEGDSRFDQVFHRLAQKPKLTLQKNKKVFVAGSTWPEDESALWPALPALMKDYHVVLCPHDVSPQNLTRLKKQLADASLEFDLFSDVFNEALPIQLSSKILLIDRVGYLAHCYRFADCALIGGSFRARTHSVMESLCCGCGVIVGPYYRNNAEAVRYLHQFVLPIKNNAEIRPALEKLNQIEPEQIISEMKKNLNASEKFFAKLP